MLTFSHFWPWAFPKSSPLNWDPVSSGSRNASSGSLHEGSWNSRFSGKLASSNWYALKLSKAEVERPLSLAARVRAARRRARIAKENIDSNQENTSYHASGSQFARLIKRPCMESLASADDAAAGPSTGIAEIEDVVMSVLPDEESMPSGGVGRDLSIENSNAAVEDRLPTISNGSASAARPILARRPLRPLPRRRVSRASQDVTMLDPDVRVVRMGTPTASLPKALAGRRLPWTWQSNLKRSAPLSIHVQTPSPRKRRKLEDRPAIITCEWYEDPYVTLICEEHQRTRTVNKHAAIVPSLSNPMRGATHPVVWSGAVEKSLAELALDKRLRKHTPRHYLSLIRPPRTVDTGKGDKIVSAYQRMINIPSAP